MSHDQDQHRAQDGEVLLIAPMEDTNNHTLLDGLYPNGWQSPAPLALPKVKAKLCIANFIDGELPADLKQPKNLPSDSHTRSYPSVSYCDIYISLYVIVPCVVGNYNRGCTSLVTNEHLPS